MLQNPDKKYFEEKESENHFEKCQICEILNIEKVFVAKSKSSLKEHLAKTHNICAYTSGNKKEKYEDVQEFTISNSDGNCETEMEIDADDIFNENLSSEEEKLSEISVNGKDFDMDTRSMVYRKQCQNFN